METKKNSHNDVWQIKPTPFIATDGTAEQRIYRGPGL